MQKPESNPVFVSLTKSFGPEQGERLFQFLGRLTNGGFSLQQELCRVLIEHNSGSNHAFLEKQLQQFCMTKLYRELFFPDMTYIEYLFPVFRSVLIFNEKPYLLEYPDYPQKSVFERKKVNLAELYRELQIYLEQIPGGAEQKGGDTLFTLFMYELFRQEKKQKQTAESLQYFISGLQYPPEKGGHFYLLMWILLFFIRSRGVQPYGTLQRVRAILQTNKIDPRDVLFILYDFYIDNRYTSDHLGVIFSLITACVKAFYPHRKQLIPKILALLKDFIRISKTKSSQYTKTIFDLFVQNPYIDMTEWVEEGARIIREHGDASKSAEAYFSKESDLSRRIWKKIDAGIHFDQVNRRLQFFANAITEGEVYLKSNKSVPLWNNYHLFYTDGSSVFVPEYVNYQKDRQKNFTMILHSVAHECAHIEFGSFLNDESRYKWAVSTFRSLFPGEIEKNRYTLKAYLDKVRNMLEEMGYEVRMLKSNPEAASCITRLLFHAPYPHAFAGIWNIVEDYRVDTLLYRKYPGYRKEKKFVDATDFETVPDLNDLNLADNIINGLIQYIRFGKLKGAIHESSEEIFGDITGILAGYSVTNETDVYASLVTAARIYAQILDHLKEHAPELLEEFAAKSPQLLLNEQDEFGTTNNRNSLLPIEIQVMKNRLAPKGQEKIDNQAKERKTKLTMAGALEAHARLEHQFELDGARQLYTYPEWDYQKNCYITERCILADIPWHSRELKNDDLKSRYGNYLASVRNVFLKLRPQRYLLQRGVEDGFELDFDRYIDCLMDFATGNEMENNFYIFRQRQERDVSAALVLDMSPSTDEKIDESTIFLYEKYATYLLSEALHASGDRFGVFSFFDFGPEASLFYTLKDFSDDYGPEHYQRLSEFQSAEDGFSRLAVGLRHVIARMKEEQAKIKIMFFITDGLPFYFEGTINEGKTAKQFQIDGMRTVTVDTPVPVVSVVSKEKRYIQEDLRKVYEEAALAGINLFCITLDPESVEFMTTVFGNRLIYLPEIADLPKRLLEIFRKVTR